MATIRITDLKLRTIIGINDWERDQEQDIIINITMEYDATKAIKSDKIKDTIDYKTITKKIIKAVQPSRFFLLEKLTNFILDIVMENSFVNEATVRVDKPMALRFARSVSVEITRKRFNKAIIGLGSNIDPQRNIQKAKKLLAKKFYILAESRFVRTKPVGFKDQPDFLNGAVYLETELKQGSLRQALKNLEVQLGRRVSLQKFGPRTIDLDLIVWNDRVVHNDFYERNFLRKAVFEVFPELEVK